MLHFRPLLPAFALCLLASAAQAQSLASRLGTMTEEQVIDGCSCTFAAKGGKGRLAKGYVLSADLEGENAKALMVVDGSRMTLRQVRATYSDKRLKRGVKWSALYASPDGRLRVGVETTIVRDCSGRGEDCEAYDHDGTLTLSQGDFAAEKLPIKGVCGC